MGTSPTMQREKVTVQKLYENNIKEKVTVWCVLPHIKTDYGILK